MQTTLSSRAAGSKGGSSSHLDGLRVTKQGLQQRHVIAKCQCIDDIVHVTRAELEQTCEPRIGASCVVLHVHRQPRRSFQYSSHPTELLAGSHQLPSRVRQWWGLTSVPGKSLKASLLAESKSSLLTCQVRTVERAGNGKLYLKVSTGVSCSRPAANGCSWFPARVSGAAASWAELRSSLNLQVGNA